MEFNFDELAKLQKKQSRMRLYGIMLKRLNSLCICILAVLFLFYVHTFSFQEKKIIEDKIAELSEAKTELKSAILKNDQLMRKNKAIQQEPAYLELIARDTLNYYKEGEIIFDIDREGR